MNTIQNIPLEKIVRNRFQQEGVRDIAKIAEIVSSLKQNENNGTKGLLQVPTARLNADGMYELAFGHHRFYAFLHLVNTVGDLFFNEMPLIVRELSDIEMFELMAIENFHRRDIGAMEEAHTLHSYMTTFKKTSLEAALKFEKTEEYVRGAIRLLNLPESAQVLMRDGKINKSQARDLLVAEKLGGADLVQEIVDEIESDGESANATETIDQVLRMSNQTVFIDKDAGWFSAKKFPVKHLAKLTAKDIHDLIEFDLTGYNIRIDDVIKDMMVLISSGMEVEDEAFPMVEPDSLARLRVLVNPPQCEKCPFHAVLNGNHYCGLGQCKKSKTEAWKKKEVEDEVQKIGIPLYQKSDGAYSELERGDDGDKKLFTARGADLRLLPAQYMWNNFTGISQNFKVVVIGTSAEARLKKEQARSAREEKSKNSAAKEREIQNTKEEFLVRFEWEVVSLAFECVLEGITSMPFLNFHRIDLIEWHADDTRFPEDVDEEKLIKAANEAKKSDGLKTLRRINMFHAVERAHYQEFSFSEVRSAKKPIIKYAADFTKLAIDWGVTLPKDFNKQAETYQAELEAAIKGL